MSSKKIIQVLAVLAAIVILQTCSTVPKRYDFRGFVPAAESWEEILAEPRDVAVEIWNTGRIFIPTSGLINRNHKNAPEIPKKKQFYHVPVYFITTPDKGSLLIDAGMDKSYQENRYKYFSGLVVPFVLPKGVQERGQSIGERIAERGITLSAIYFTHLHFDHAAGLMDLNIDFPLIAGKDEKLLDIPLLFHSRHFDRIGEIQSLDFSKGKSLYPFESVIDLLGDNSVFAISTCGHSSGHVSYLVNGKKGPILIGGDQINCRENVTSGVGPGSYSANIKKAQRYFDQLMEFVKLYPETTIYYGHDIEE